MLGDEKRLIQVISNLLGNAAKYTLPAGTIKLQVRVAEPYVELRVEDNGIGMDADLLPHIFDLFKQAKRTSGRSQGGLGMGLALVRSIVLLHRGEVHAHSDGPGKGSSFTVLLPALPLTEQPATVNGSVAKSVEPQPVNLMIVDDNVDAARMLAALLEAKGHQVSVLASAISALEASQHTLFPFYILDIGLPDMDGYELARRLRSSANAKDAVLIALTGYGQFQDRHAALASGFDYHFVKPIDIAALDSIFSSAFPRATQH